MGPNSAARKLLKRILFPLLNGRIYQYIQGASKAWDTRTGHWTEPELDLIPFAVRPGDTALDLGANFGLYTYHLSRTVGPSGRVYAFEPVPFTFNSLRLASKLQSLRNVELVEKGCNDKAGRITFSVPLQSSGALSAGQAYIGGRDDDRAGKEGQVRWRETREVVCEVVALDEFLPTLKDLSLIKCDIEGAELHAFRGGQNLIKQHLPTVICEINPWFLEGFGLRLEDLTGFFFEKGYELYHYRIGASGGRLWPVDVEEIVEDNYVFIHPARRDRFNSLLAQGNQK
jgi:FkbM family methyltransferase